MELHPGWHFEMSLSNFLRAMLSSPCSALLRAFLHPAKSTMLGLVSSAASAWTVCLSSEWAHSERLLQGSQEAFEALPKVAAHRVPSARASFSQTSLYGAATQELPADRLVWGCQDKYSLEGGQQAVADFQRQRRSQELDERRKRLPHSRRACQ